MLKYTLFIGLNDKDTKHQELTTGEAFDRVLDVLKAHNINGATLSIANGYWNGESENTIRCEIVTETDTTESIRRIIETLKTKAQLNQDSIMLEISRPNLLYI